MSVLQTMNLKKYYGAEPNIVRALDGVDFSVDEGEFVAVIGASGSGKSTLLNMMGGLDTPTSGRVIVRGQDLVGMEDEALTLFRRRNIGFVFQNYNLVPMLSVRENIVLPVELDGHPADRGFLEDIVSMLGLKDRLYAMPNMLSGGQQQRAAIARALITKPAILLADEPTGSLDSQTSADVLELLRRSSRRFHQTVVMIIHNSKRKHRVIALVMCFLVLTLSGCSRGNGNYNQVTAVDRVSSQTSTSISSEHKLLDGREQYTIHVSDGEELAVLISILNQNGSLSLTIGKSGSTPVYTGNDIESSSFTVYLRESGDYSVIIDANNHEGSYSLDWSAISSASAPDAPERTITYSMLLGGKETTVYLDVSDEEITLWDSASSGRIIAAAKYTRPMPGAAEALRDCDFTDLDEDGNSDLTAEFAFADGSTASLVWFYADGGLVCNEEFSRLSGEQPAAGTDEANGRAEENLK